LNKKVFSVFPPCVIVVANHNPAKTGTEAVGKLSGFIAAIRRCVSDALALIVFAVAMAIAPICALAAPYADFVIDARTGEVLAPDQRRCAAAPGVADQDDDAVYRVSGHRAG
jgi:hypothetical protein